MFSALLLTAVLLAPAQGAAPPAPAQTPPAADRARELEIEYQLLLQQYTRSESEWSEAVRAAAADLARRQELATKHPVHAYWARFRKLADAKHGRALLWLATHAENQYSEKQDVAAEKTRLFHALVEGHASEDWSLEIVDALARQRNWLETKGVRAELEAFAAGSRKREFAAAALLRVAAILSGPAAKGEEQKQAEEVRARIQKEFPETEAARKLAGGKTAAPASLGPGSKAPEFAGKDADGAEIKLSDFQGRVVLLDFWGFWCPHCRALLPHLRELAEKYKDAPFTILGVTSDEDPAQFRELAKQNALAWRSVWDGGRNGPVGRLYQVRSAPTLFLIDAQGLIQRTWVGEPNEPMLDEAIATLVAAARAARK